MVRSEANYGAKCVATVAHPILNLLFTSSAELCQRWVPIPAAKADKRGSAAPPAVRPVGTAKKLLLCLKGILSSESVTTFCKLIYSTVKEYMKFSCFSMFYYLL